MVDGRPLTLPTREATAERFNQLCLNLGAVRGDPCLSGLPVPRIASRAGPLDDDPEELPPELLELPQGEPLVVFSAYRAPVDLLAGREGWASITGDTSSTRRGEIVEAFQTLSTWDTPTYKA